MKSLSERAQDLRNALYYAFVSVSTTKAEYRTRGRGEWKALTDSKFVNFDKYDYRTVERHVWLDGTNIRCSNGGISQTLAKRILAIVARKSSFTIAGYDVIRFSNGSISVGCTTFAKEDVQHARRLLAGK